MGDNRLREFDIVTSIWVHPSLRRAFINYQCTVVSPSGIVLNPLRKGQNSRLTSWMSRISVPLPIRKSTCRFRYELTEWKSRSALRMRFLRQQVSSNFSKRSQSSDPLGTEYAKQIIEIYHSCLVCLWRSFNFLNLDRKISLTAKFVLAASLHSRISLPLSLETMMRCKCF